MRFGCVVAALAALVLAAPAQADGGVDLERLQVEKKAEPIGIDVDRPRFSWVIGRRASAASSSSPTGCASRGSGSTGRGKAVWDSGDVRSPRVGRRRVRRAGAGAGDRLRLGGRRQDQRGLGDARARRSAPASTPTPTGPGSAWIGNARTLRRHAARPSTARPGSGRRRRPARPPAEPRAFRTTRTTPAGKTATGAEILITADDSLPAVGQRPAARSRLGREQRVAAVTPLRDRAGAGPQRLRRPDHERARLAGRPDRPGPHALRRRHDRSSSARARTGRRAKTFPEDFWQPAFDDSALGRRGRAGDLRRRPLGSQRARRRATRRGPRRCCGASSPSPGRSATRRCTYAAGGYANVSLNGAPASEDVLSPGFTDYDDTVQYDDHRPHRAS